MSEVFVSSEARYACSCGVIMAEARWTRVPEVQVRIPSRGMGTFFYSCRQLYLSSFSYTHIHAHTRTHMRACTHTHTCMHVT